MDRVKIEKKRKTQKLDKRKKYKISIERGRFILFGESFIRRPVIERQPVFLQLLCPDSFAGGKKCLSFYEYRNE
jgi:hypothetical protein